MLDFALIGEHAHFDSDELQRSVRNIASVNVAFLALRADLHGLSAQRFFQVVDQRLGYELLVDDDLDRFAGRSIWQLSSGPDCRTTQRPSSS